MDDLRQPIIPNIEHEPFVFEPRPVEPREIKEVIKQPVTPNIEHEPFVFDPNRQGVKREVKVVFGD